MKTVLKKIVICIVIIGFILGCSTPPEKIKSSYVSPLQYNNFNCNQIRMEIQRVDRKLREVTESQRQEANKDAVAIGVGACLFWPALFMTIGQDHSTELARLKGEFDALEQAAIHQECDITKDIEQIRLQREKKEAERKKKAEEFQKGLSPE